jgi:hypothetical protein
MKKIIFVLTASFLLMTTALFAQSISTTLFYVATSGMTQPESPDTFRTFQAPHLSLGRVVFVGHGTRNTTGLYANLRGPVGVIANTRTLAPHDSGSFTSFRNLLHTDKISASHTSSIYGDHIAFLGTDAQWRTGIYRYSIIRDIDMVANQVTPIPHGQGRFIGFAYPTMMANNGVAFWGKGNTDQEGIYRTNKHGLLRRLADTNTNIPEGKGKFQHFLDMSFSHNAKTALDFAFIGEGISQQTGIYRMKAGHMSKLADTNTHLPGKEVGFFTQFSDLDYDAAQQRVVFVGHGILEQQGIYLTNGKQAALAVSQQSLLPDGVGHFVSFSHPSFLGNSIVFQGVGARGEEGVFLYHNDGLYKLMSTLDTLNHQAIVKVLLSDDATSNHQLAVLVKFKNNTEGVYIISLQDDSLVV